MRTPLCLLGATLLLTGCHGRQTVPNKPHRAAPLGNSRIQYASGTLVATDPDHDSIWMSNIVYGWLEQFEFGSGEEPGDVSIASRAVLTAGNPDFRSVAYVSLHGGGAVVSIPLYGRFTGNDPFKRIPVCAEPRGIDSFDQPDGHSFVYVACADGVLVTIDANTDAVISTLPLADDLRDVVMLDDHTALVTQFRSANVMQVDLTSGSVVAVAIPGTPDRVADVAWQMIPLGSRTVRTGALVVHQLASTRQIGLGTCVCTCGDGSCSIDRQGNCSDGTNCRGCGGHGNYGPSSCASCAFGIVAAAATVVTPSPSGGAPMMKPAGMFPGLQGPLTAATWRRGDGYQQATIIGVGSGITAIVDVTGLLARDASPSECLFVSTDWSADALTYAQWDRSTNTGDSKYFFRRQSGASPGMIVRHPPGHLAETITLPLREMTNEAGRDLFYQPTPAGLSCASCHPNGRDDGHVWNFEPGGLRRTPSLGGGVLSTAPFHWDGAEKDLTQLMSDVFVTRMQGSLPDNLDDLGQWLDALPVARAHSAPLQEAVGRGKRLFESSQTGCVSCHSGEHFTNNQTVDVGTGGAFQVPTLLGLGARAPYLHDGRARTLADRFGPGGGGDLHGKTSQLTPSEVDDLVAYLRSL